MAACIFAVLQAGPDAARAAGITELSCLDFRIEGDGTYNPEIVLSNACGDVVFWRLCVNYKARLERGYLEGAIRPGETTRIEAYPAEGEEFSVGGWAQTGSDVVRAPQC